MCVLCNSLHISYHYHTYAVYVDILLVYIFVVSFKLWDATVQCLSVLDVLMSLAVYSGVSNGVMCRPEFQYSKEPFIEIREGRHPYITRTFTRDDFIPNDTTIGLPMVMLKEVLASTMEPA